MADEVVIHGGDFEEMERKNQELNRQNLDLKVRLDKLLREIEDLKGGEAEMNQRIEEMEKEYEEDKKALESISTRAVELETEVASLQDELIGCLNGVNKTGEEVAELKKALGEKDEKLEGFEKEAESLRRGRADGEKKVRDLERKIGVFEVREVEEKSKKVRLEEEVREKLGEKEREINELEKKVGVLSLELVKNVEELEKRKSEKKLVEGALSEVKDREKEIELKKDKLLKKVEEGKKTARGGSDGIKMKAEIEWPMFSVGAVAIVGLVAASLFFMDYKRRS